MIPSKPTLPKSVALVAIYHLMPVIQVQIGKNFIEYVLLDGDPGVNIIMKKLRVQLSLSRFESNYSKWTGKSSGKLTGENICRSSSGGAQEKRKMG
jgi:hypothetical protein